MPDKLINTGWHWEYGWLRRPELDDQNGYCYEEPDGDLVYTAEPRHRKAVRLNLWEEPEKFLGQPIRYVAISPVPCRAHRLAR